MPKEFSRSRRISEQVQRTLSELIRRDVKDPRVAALTVTAVDVSGDLGHARVYYSLLDPDGDPAGAQEALTGAAGFLRSRLGRTMHTRQVPQLHFEHDVSLARAARLSDLIDEAVASDRPDPDET